MFSNKERIQMLTFELSKLGYDILAKIINEAIEQCPIFASQNLDPCLFLNELTEMLDGLAYKHLQGFVRSHEESITAHQIAAQAMKIKSALWISNGLVLVAINTTNLKVI